VKEFSDIIKSYDNIDKSSVRLAMATVIDVKGSSYRRTGARMLIQDNGIWTGGISGGCIEGDALKKANLAISGAKAIKVTYDTSKENEEQIGVSLGCSGIIDVLISPIDPKDNNNQVEQLRNCIKSREPKVLVTVLESEDSELSPGKVYYYSKDEEVEHYFGKISSKIILQNIKEILKNEKTEIKELETHKLLFEFVPPTVQVIIMGGNYDVYPLLKVVHNLGWQSIVVANPRRLAKNIHSLADEVDADFDNISIDKYTVGILMSHDFNADLKNLRKVLKSDLSYIGLLGPVSRKSDLLADLQFEVSEEDKERIFGPVGLDIGASQPEEIAISIVSEILTVMRHRPGSSLRSRQGPIYNR